MCARKHPSDDDRQHPRGLADALLRWDTDQDWMRPTPGREAASSVGGTVLSVEKFEVAQELAARASGV